MRTSDAISCFVASISSLDFAMVRPPLSNIDPKRIFLHARGFHQAESHIANVDIDKNPQLALEMSQAQMVLSAFISELYFKCIICIETGLTPAGHELDKLFDQLSPTSKELIEKIWDKEVIPMRNPMWTKIEDEFGDGDTLKRGFRDAIEAGSRAFEIMRYGYEPQAKNSKFYISDLPQLLHRVILGMKPEWRTLRHPVSQVPGGFPPHIKS